jgi:predicted amidohydrolase
MIVDPWGDIVGKTGSETGLAIANLSHERIRTIRERIPILANRRSDIY